MLAGLNLQPGAWDATQGLMDDVLISDLTMHNVATPFHFFIKPGNTAGNIQVNRVNATGVYRAASAVESWAATPFTNVVFRDVTVEYKGGGTLDQSKLSVKSPGVDARVLPAWGFYAKNVQNLEFDNVRFRYEKEDLRPVFILDGVERLVLDDFKYPWTADVPEVFRLNDVAQVQCHGTDLVLLEPPCTDLKIVATETDKRLMAGRPYSVSVTVENGEQQGPAQIKLEVAGQKITRWVWLRAQEKKEVLIKGLTLPAAGTYTLRCGSVTQNLQVEP